MINKSKMKVYVFILGLMLAVGQGFAAADCLETATVWKDCVSQPKDTTIGGVKYKKITTEKELAWLSNNIGNNAILLNNLDMGGKLWIPIAAGNGSDKKYEKIFDGNGHVISNLYINGDKLSAINKNYPQNLGFVGVLANGTVKNLILENVDIYASTKSGDIVSNKDSQISVGAVVGWLSDKATSNVVDNCMASGTIKTTGSGQGVGGIVGNAKICSISNCLSLVEIQTSGADAYIGGIIGITKTDVTVSSCVYAGPGLVNTGANGSVGGVVGNVFSGTATATDSYFEGDFTYNGNAVAGVGKNCDTCTVNNTTQKADSTNIEDIACALNGENTDGTCKEEPWSVGLTGLSLNGYGADGYKITFSANGGAFAGSVVTKNIYLASGMTISDGEIGKPSRDGFSFEGWATAVDAVAPLENLGTVSKSAKFYAVWAPLNTITFNVAPGTFPSGEQTKIKQVANGEAITVEGLGDLPMFYCEEDGKTEENCDVGHYFTGWKLEGVNVKLEDLTATGNLELDAVWETVKTYTVTYNANEHGVTTVSFVRVGEGEMVQQPTPPVADDGYEFVGWFTESTCENSFTFDEKIDHSYILYAKWNLLRFNISYELNEGSINGSNPSSYTIDTSFVLNAPADVDGYVFEGWFYDPQFKNPATQIIQGTTGSKTFYAKWSKTTYRIMYLADNNSYGSISDQFVEHGTTINLESAGIFRRPGYEQDGWSTAMAGAKEYALGASLTITAPLTLYPTWEIVRYTITYDCEGCGVSDVAKFPTTYTIDTSFSIPNPASIPSGYKFGGWYKNAEFSGKQNNNVAKGTYGDFTFYGKLNKIYHITYVLNGSADNRNKDDYTVEDKAYTLQAPAPVEGFFFGGWFDNADFEGDAVTVIPQGSTGDMTLYAKWIPETVVTQYGAVTITETNTKVDGEIVSTRTAVINGNYDGVDAMDIPEDIEVTSVTLERTFNNTASTLILPFDIEVENVSGARFYNLNGIDINEETGRRVVHFKREKSLIHAHTPYGIRPAVDFDGETYSITFNGPVTIKNTVDINPVVTIEGEGRFTGSYANKTVSEDESGKYYGFAGKNVEGVPTGTFVRLGTGASIPVLRAYIVNLATNRARSLTATPTSGKNVSSLKTNVYDTEWSEEEDVLPEEEEQTLVLKKQPQDIQVKQMNRVYDLKGRMVNSKKASKGVYLDKKVIAK